MNQLSRSTFVLVSLLTVQAFAQTESQPASPSAAVLPPITVMGDSDKTSALDYLSSVSELSGERLEQKKESTLGETLSREVGVSSSFFGPNASRPVIRGLGGERIRVLSNGTGVLDASAASEDHAVAMEPITIERVEIVRGPAALLYGSSAVGGVVNVITNRIPEKYEAGLQGELSGRFTSNDDGGQGGLGIDYGAFENWAFHADFSSRKASDYRIPGFARTAVAREDEPLDPGEEEAEDKVPNSFNETLNGAFGASYIFSNGYFGLSYSKYNSQYGTVAEPEVSIDLDQDRFDLAGELRELGWVQSVRLKSSVSDYRHQELEGDEPGTTFKNRGHESRVEVKHRRTGALDGLFGVQANVFTFEALGEEAFLPKTDNSSYSLFAYEEAHLGDFEPSIGLRGDVSEVKSSVADDQTAQFGASETKNFTGGSASVGNIYSVNSKNSVALNLAYAERAPNYQELFANGPHLATAAFEIGDRNLKKERSNSAELSWRHKAERIQGSVGVFVQDFKNFIALSPTGNTQAGPEGPLDEFLYTPVEARLYGAEFELRQEFEQTLFGGVFGYELKIDMVRGKNRTADTNLPRITPMRESITLNYKQTRYSLNAEFERAEKQTLTAPNEVATDAYNIVNLGASAPILWGPTTFNVFAKVNNVFDVEARNHVSFLKEIAPLPGRNAVVGVRALF